VEKANAAGKRPRAGVLAWICRESRGSDEKLSWDGDQGPGVLLEPHVLPCDREVTALWGPLLSLVWPQGKSPLFARSRGHGVTPGTGAGKGTRAPLCSCTVTERSQPHSATSRTARQRSGWDGACQGKQREASSRPKAY
jgi:hypothetical protein